MRNDHLKALFASVADVSTEALQQDSAGTVRMHLAQTALQAMHQHFQVAQRTHAMHAGLCVARPRCLGA